LADFYAKFDPADSRRGIAPGSIPGLAFGKPFAGIGLGVLTGQQKKDDGTDLVDTRTGLPLKFTPDVPLSGAATDKGYRVMKYHPAFYDKYILIRFAEVYLNMIEAKVRGGSDPSSTTTALQDINALRALRGAPALAGGPTLDQVLDERGIELYWEGLRRIDLIRHGKFNEPWEEKGSNTDAYRVVFSIPQLAIDSNPNLKQNKGYPGGE
jgi:starch-binding outer membrane protein, SusD/RagB family